MLNRSKHIVLLNHIYRYVGAFVLLFVFQKQHKSFFFMGVLVYGVQLSNVSYIDSMPLCLYETLFE